MYNSWGSYAPYSPLYTPIPTHVASSQSVPTSDVTNARTSIAPATPKFKATLLLPEHPNGIRLNARLDYMIGPHIEYDVRHNPAYAFSPNAESEWLHEPATSPHTIEMIIICTALPRPFIVRPSSRDHNFVTVRDVLVTTHNAFCANQSAVAADGWIPGFLRQADGTWHQTSLLMSSPSISGASTDRYKWMGLSEQYEVGRWLLHVEEFPVTPLHRNV